MLGSELLKLFAWRQTLRPPSVARFEGLLLDMPRRFSRGFTRHLETSVTATGGLIIRSRRITSRLGAGFTMVEILVVLVVLGVLATITYSVAVPKYRERTYFTRANVELRTMANALTLYVAKYNDYPADVSRAIPAGIMEFVQTNGINGLWPNAPWPGSVYDYDRWDTWAYTDSGDLPPPIVQISIRFCNAGDDTTCKTNANKYLKGTIPDSVLANWDSYSSVYYCIKGSCRSHAGKPANHPGYCANCSGTSKFY